LDAKDLKVFEAVARCEGMKRAALELNTVQSNVTGRIRRLEEELGVPLFERRPNGMKLTPAGVRLLPYAFEVRAAIFNAKRAVSDEGKPSGPLVIGFRKSTSELHLTALLAAYAGKYPDVEIRIRTETSPILAALVQERRIEGAFVCDPMGHKELVSEIIFDEELVILTAQNVENLKLLSADTRLIVLGQGSLYEKQLKAVLKRRGILATRTMELGTLENIIGCVSLGLGITLLPKAVASMRWQRHSVYAHEITDEDCRVKTLFVHRHDAFVSSALSAFLDCARNYSKNLAPE
jgi:DNA-binding transcriptional LysR family regulator